ncbi:MAG: hypothetical protein Nk1A_8400 [Endomicrobiia bacterium]|nr:MAG: hypothetical protein Nk1A_8400 [Endomicrobiia bacterium]
MIALLLFIILVYYSYLSMIYVLFGIPVSISQTFYLLQAKYEGTGFIFTWWLLFLALLVEILVLALNISLISNIIMTIATICLTITAFTPFYHSPEEKDIHPIAAAIAIVFSIIWTVLLGYWLIPLLVICGTAFMARNSKSMTFYIENSAFISLFTALYLYILGSHV